MVKGHCTVCNKSIEDTEKESKVHYAGLQSFISKSKDVQDEKYHEWEQIRQGEYIVLHEACRKRYLKQASKPVDQRRKRRRSIEPQVQAVSDNVLDDIPTKPFDYETLCILCDQLLDSKRKKVHVLSCEFEQTTIIDWATSKNDEEAREILRRIKYVQNNNICAMYHDACKKRTKKIKISPEENLVIDPIIEKVANYIETSGNFKFDLATLRKIMYEENDTLSLSEFVLSNRLQEKFGEDLLIIRQHGKQPLYFYKTKSFFDRSADRLANPQDLSEFEKNIVLQISAEIIRNDILNKQYEVQEYAPGQSSLSTVMSDIPTSLKILLDKLLPSEKDDEANVKRASIAHRIISIIRPRTFISKLQLAVGTYVHQKTSSKLIINLLNKLGISASYHDIRKYEASTAINPPEVDVTKELAQFVFDKADNDAGTSKHVDEL